jgi:hypothetical protein
LDDIQSLLPITLCLHEIRACSRYDTNKLEGELCDSGAPNISPKHEVIGSTKEISNLRKRLARSIGSISQSSEVEFDE